MPTRRLTLIALLSVLLIALVGRGLLLASGAVSFHSDEAVVALMARHILQGERPVFFYGQAYMGSLDAWLVAGMFTLMGQSVLAIRIVQSTLYLGMVAVVFALGLRLSGKLSTAVIAGLLMAVPNTLVALYTTATLGGYNETLLLGGLILLLGYGVIRETATLSSDAHPRWWRYAALGVCAGLGWWTNGLIVAYAAPVALFLLYRIIARRRPLARFVIPIGTALVAFVIASAPWWAFNFDNDFAALRFYIPNSTPSEFAGGDVQALSTTQRLVGLFFLGMPAVIGLRYPWTPDYLFPPLALFTLVLYVLAGYGLARGRGSRQGDWLLPDARPLLLLGIGIFVAIFLVSRFSTDPTGRYFLPLTAYFAVMIAAFVTSLRPPLVRVGVIGLLLVYHLSGVIGAVQTQPPGLTTQFNLDTHLPNTDDAALIAFLDENGLTRGYTHYWINFRIAFLSEERLQYSAALPYKPDLGYTPRDNRYAPYVQAVAAAPDAQIAYVTANIREVKNGLEAWFAASGVTYTYAQVGIYHIYYNFAPTVPRPPEQIADVLR